MTREDVVSVFRAVDDTMIAEVVLSDASLDELREAWGWAFGEDALIGKGRPLPGTRVAALIDLDEDEMEDPAKPGPDET